MNFKENCLRKQQHQYTFTNFALEKKTFSSAFYLIRKTLIRCSYSPAFFDMLNKRSGVGSTLGNYS